MFSAVPPNQQYEVLPLPPTRKLQNCCKNHTAVRVFYAVSIILTVISTVLIVLMVLTMIRLSRLENKISMLQNAPESPRAEGERIHIITIVCLRT